MHALQNGDMCNLASEDPSYNVLMHQYEESVPSNPDHDFPAYAMLQEVNKRPLVWTQSLLVLLVCGLTGAGGEIGGKFLCTIKVVLMNLEGGYSNCPLLSLAQLLDTLLGFVYTIW